MLFRQIIVIAYPPVGKCPVIDLGEADNAIAVIRKWVFSCVLIKDKIERVQQELIALPLFALWQQTGQRHLQHSVLAVDSDAVHYTGGFEIVTFADGCTGINQMPQPAGNPLCP